MPTKIELLQEAEKRGILPESKKALYAEALKRGLIKSKKNIIEEPEMGASHTQRIDTGLQPSHAQMTPDERFGGPKSKIVSEIARPIISGITGAGGAMIGTGAGPGFGTAIGGGLGYSIGEEIADKLDEFLGLKEPGPLQVELKKAITERTNLGAAYEVGGLAAAATLSPILKFGGKQISKIMPFSKAGAEVKAGKQLIAQTDNGPMVANNYEEAKELENLIPGLKFSRGQLTNDPSVVKWERSMLRMPGRAATGSAEQTAQNTDAIKTYITKAKGTGAIEDVTGALTTQREAAETGVTEAQKALERETIPGGVGIVEGGEQIRGAARTAERQAKKTGGELFEDVPQFEIEGKRILDKIDEISEPFTRMERIDKTIPEEFEWFTDKIKETGGKVTPQDLQDMSSDIGESIAAIKNSQASTKFDRTKSRRLAMLKQEIDDVLKETGEVTTTPKQITGETGPKEELKALSDKIEKEGVGFDAFYNKNNDSFELSRIVVPEPQRDTGIGTKAMKELINMADRRGKIITLTPSKDFGGKIGKLKKFYKELGFVENKGKNKDYRFRDTYLREPIKSKFVQKEAPKQPTIQQAKHKGKIIYPERLKEEISRIDKKLKTEPHTTSNEIDTKKTYKELSDKNVLGIMQNVNESNTDYTKRIANQYKIHLKKDAPLVPGKERPAITAAKDKKAKLENILSESVDIEPATMAEAAGKLKDARGFWRKEVIQKYQQGTVGDILKKGAKGDKVGNAQVASRFFKPGPAGVQQADEFLNAIGDNPEAKQAMEDFIKQDLLNYSTNPVTGEVTQAKLKTWLNKYKPSLKKYGMDKRFDSIVKTRTELDDALLFKKEFDKSQASKLLNSDVDKAVQNALSTGSKGASARKLMSMMKGDKQAISGLQNSIIDQILYKDAIEQTPRTIAKVNDQYLKYKPALAVVFKDSPNKLKALNTYRNALDKMEILNRSPIGPGSATMELQETGKAIEAATGLSKNWIYTVGKTIANITKGNSDKAVKMLLHRAAYDPDFAFTLMLAAKGRSKDVIKQRLYGHLTAMGLRGTIKKEK